MSDMLASDKEIDTSSTISSNVHGGQKWTSKGREFGQRSEFYLALMPWFE
jgi:hypothetical protein